VVPRVAERVFHDSVREGFCATLDSASEGLRDTMPWYPGPASTALSRTDARRSAEPSCPGSKQRSSPFARTSRLRATRIALAHRSSGTCERTETWTRAQAGANRTGPRGFVGFTVVFRTRFTTPARRVNDASSAGQILFAQGRDSVLAVAAKLAAGAALNSVAATPLGYVSEGTKSLPIELENAVGLLIQSRDGITISVDARVSGSGCAKMRKTARNRSRRVPRTAGRAATITRPSATLSREENGGRGRAGWSAKGW
jgi:hypothetical protein